MVHANFIEEDGDLIDIEYFCSGACFEIGTGLDAFGHAWPGGSETEYDVHCAYENCNQLLWKGLETVEDHY